MPSHKDHLTSVTLAALIICLGSARIPLTRLSANTEHKYDYLPVTVNICAEAIKFTICFLLSIRFLYKEGRNISEIFVKSSNSKLHILKWSIPGLLYFLDNLIGFYTLTYLEPAVMVLLNNFVIISTSILFRLILKVQINRIQWASIVVVFLAIVSLSNDSSSDSDNAHHRQDNNVNRLLVNMSIKYNHKVMCSYEKQYEKKQFLATKHILKIQEENTKTENKIFNMGHLLVVISCFFASLANVYNEKIFKEDGGLQESIFLQNTKLYMFGVFFNLITLLTHSGYRKRVWKCGFFDGYNIFASLLIFDTAFIGLTVSLILKFKDNMFHVFSSQIMTVVVITFSIFQFGYNPTLNFYLQAPIVLLSIYIYTVSKHNHNGGHIHVVHNTEDDEYRDKEPNQTGVVSDQMELLLRHNSTSECD